MSYYFVGCCPTPAYGTYGMSPPAAPISDPANAMDATATYSLSATFMMFTTDGNTITPHNGGSFTATLTRIGGSNQWSGLTPLVQDPTSPGSQLQFFIDVKLSFNPTGTSATRSWSIDLNGSTGDYYGTFKPSGLLLSDPGSWYAPRYPAQSGDSSIQALTVNPNGTFGGQLMQLNGKSPYQSQFLPVLDNVSIT